MHMDSLVQVQMYMTILAVRFNLISKELERALMISFQRKLAYSNIQHQIVALQVQKLGQISELIQTEVKILQLLLQVEMV
jgi:hypothetical protein